MIKTRFAPSPTGQFHLGSARTALFAWAHARHHQGQFVLRIEDTDRARSTQESIDIILQSMQWLGLDYDEGPYYQTKRYDRYREVIAKLLAEGHAYRCTCSKERLTELREQQQQQKIKPRYDGHCRDLNLAETEKSYVIRFKNPLEGDVAWQDSVLGEIRIGNAELDDLIIQRSDGDPTYNFTVVVDDWDMEITDVIRGMDHINNTPRQINLLNALGATLPRYAHVPMILGNDGKKLSKRHGAVSVLQYRDEGFLPEAMLNALIRLGWSHGDQELFSKADMIEHFDIKDANKSAATFDRDKLLWVNQQLMMTMDDSALLEGFLQQLGTLGVSDVSTGPDPLAVIALQKARAKTLSEMAGLSVFFYVDQLTYDEKAQAKHLKPEGKPVLQALHDQLAALGDWQAEAIHAVVHQVAEQFELKLGKVAQPLRVAVTGGTVSPPIDQTLFLLGKDKVLARLNHCLAF